MKKTKETFDYIPVSMFVLVLLLALFSYFIYGAPRYEQEQKIINEFCPEGYTVAESYVSYCKGVPMLCDAEKCRWVDYYEKCRSQHKGGTFHLSEFICDRYNLSNDVLIGRTVT